MKMKTKICIGAAGAFLLAICVFTPLIIMYLESHAEEIKESAQTYYMTASTPSTPSAYSNMSLSDLGTVIGVLCGFAGVLYYLIRN